MCFIGIDGGFIAEPAGRMEIEWDLNDYNWAKSRFGSEDWLPQPIPDHPCMVYLPTFTP